MDRATRLRRPQIEVSYAWVIVAASFPTLTTTGGARFGFGLFFKPLEETSPRRVAFGDLRFA